MNFLSLCQRVRQESGIADSGPSQVTGQTGDLKRIVDWVNEAYMHIQRSRSSWTWMWMTSSIDTQQGVAVYSLPSGVKSIIEGTVYLDGNKILYMDYELYRDSYASISAGTPSIYSIRPDGKLILNATPGAAGEITFEAYRKPAYFAEGISAPLFPDDYHMIIVWHALYEYALFDEAPELQAKAKINYENLLADLSSATLPQITLPGPVA